MVWGINKEAVFSDKKDKEQLLQRLGINLFAGKGFVYAWVIMDNHLHFLIKSGRRGISDIMRKLLTWYASIITVAIGGEDIFSRIAINPYCVMKKHTFLP